MNRRSVEYVRLGGTGFDVSQVRPGTWTFGTEAEDGIVATDRTEAHDPSDAA